MIRKLILSFLIISILAPAVVAEELSEEGYINQLTYHRNKLELVIKKRMVDERRSYSYTDIDFTTYTWEAYTFTTGDIATQSLARAEAKEITEWYIYKGALRQLSDLEFLALVGDQAEYDRVKEIEGQKGRMRNIGNISIGVGLLAMIGGAAFSADTAIISGGAFATALGFIISALNLPPKHYIQPDYAQEKIDEYNIALKKKLDLPLDFE